MVLFSVFFMLFPSKIFAENAIKEKVEDFIEERKAGTAGVAIGFFKEGKVQHKKLYGYIDIENKIPVSDETVFEWGSISKVLVWVSIMQLYEEGLIDLDEDIKTYLPKEFSEKLKYTKKITIIDLMNHQAGFQEVVSKVEFSEGEEIPHLKDLLIMSEPTQIYPPSTTTAYSNWSTALASYIVESVSREPFYDYVREKIFMPLNMNHTAIKPDWSDNTFVKEQRRLNKSYFISTEDDEKLGDSISYIGLYPAGSCCGTFDDFLTFVSEFTTNSPRFFKNSETLDKMLQASSYYDNGVARVHHGLWALETPLHLIGHGGNTQGYTSNFMFDPLSRTGFAVISNEVGETAYNYGLIELFYGKGDYKVKAGEDISGVYSAKRTVNKGYARFLKYLAGVLPITKTESEGVYKIPVAEMSVKSLGNDAYYFDNGNGLSYINYLSQDGKTLQGYTTDYEKLALWEIVLVAVLVVGMLIIILSFLFRLIGLMIKFLRKKEIEVKRNSILSHGLAVLISIIFFYMWMIMSVHSPIKVMLLSLLCSISALIIFCNWISQLYNRYNGNDHNLLSTTLSMIAVVTVIFFELYNFWS